MVVDIKTIKINWKTPYYFNQFNTKSTFSSHKNRSVSLLYVVMCISWQYITKLLLSLLPITIDSTSPLYWP